MFRLGECNGARIRRYDKRGKRVRIQLWQNSRGLVCSQLLRDRPAPVREDVLDRISEVGGRERQFDRKIAERAAEHDIAIFQVVRDLLEHAQNPLRRSIRRSDRLIPVCSTARATRSRMTAKASAFLVGKW